MQKCRCKLAKSFGKSGGKSAFVWVWAWALAGCAGLAQGGVTARAEDARAHPAAGEDEHSLSEKLPAWDEASGRKVASWPKTRAFDFLSSAIELEVPSMQQASLRGRVTHEAVVIALPQGEMVLDCNGPVVRSVSVNGVSAEFAMRRARSWLGTFASLRDVEGRAPRQELVIFLPSVLSKGQRATVVIDYDLAFGENEARKEPGVGLTWHATQEGKPFVHAQGQAEWSSGWFPCFDAPSEFVRSSVRVDVEDGFTVVSNGTLVSRTPSGNGRTTWQWSMPREHAVYLTTLAIGEFEEVQVGGEAGARPGLSMPVWVPAGNAEAARALFSQTAPIIAFFEEVFDEPFAWPQYGQAVVPGFLWGGMENVGMTLYTAGMLEYEEQDGGQRKADGLIAHETAHQWWGNLVTCKTWDDLWINEGWATFSEALWFEHAARPEGAAAQSEAYFAEVRGWLQGQIASNATAAPADVALVSNRFRDPDSQFVKADNPYPKGALVLHALREKLGDRVFFAAARTFLDSHAGTPVETADLRKQFELTSGRSLERFFEQWVGRPGIARVQVSTVWDASAGRLTVGFEQVQRIDASNPAYALELPVTLVFADGTTSTTSVRMDARTAELNLVPASMPVALIVDERYSQLAEVRGRVTVLDSSAGFVMPSTPEGAAASRAAAETQTREE
jgi:aminopeptidase N